MDFGRNQYVCRRDRDRRGDTASRCEPNGQHSGSGNIINNGVLVFKRTGTLTVPGAISGTGSVTNDGTGTVILANNNTYSGGTINNAGTLQIGNGGGTGSLNGTSPITNNSLLVFNTTGTFNYNGNGLIDGPGNVIVQGGGLMQRPSAHNTYTGWTRIDAGSTFQPLRRQHRWLGEFGGDQQRHA